MLKPSASDKIILRLLQSNARERLETIAAESGLSVATVQRRIKALKAEGVIVGEEALISPPAVGYTMTFLILVELERERIDQVDAFRRRARAEPLAAAAAAEPRGFGEPRRRAAERAAEQFDSVRTR